MGQPPSLAGKQASPAVYVGATAAPVGSSQPVNPNPAALYQQQPALYQQQQSKQQPQAGLSRPTSTPSGPLLNHTRPVSGTSFPYPPSAGSADQSLATRSPQPASLPHQISQAPTQASTSAFPMVQEDLP
ncbi:hypothetical protein BSLG_010052 [Batrachochytrium salamandrivorans]|nr:hypothetical protein BSLG_010052 [Batrachochytrium salamandrivorans]